MEDRFGSREGRKNYILAYEDKKDAERRNGKIKMPSEGASSVTYGVMRVKGQRRA